MQAPQYILPKLGISTNDAQLKANRLKLLKQHYENKQNETFLNSKHNFLNNSSWFKSGIPQKITNEYNNPIGYNKFSLQRSSSQPKLLNKRVNQEIIKNSWSNQLSEQIALKQQIKKLQKIDDIQLEKKLVKNNLNLYQMEVCNQRDFLQSFKNQAFQNIKMKQEKKKAQRMNQRVQKSLIDKQYRDAQEIIKKKMFGVPEKRSESSLNTYNPGQMTQNPQSIQNVAKPYAYRVFNEQLKKHKDHLKQTLLQQIKMREQQQKMQKIRKVNTPFIDQKYKIVDNPIVNPIDIKIAKDNPYIMKQLLGRKALENNIVPTSRMGLPSSKQSQVSGRSSQLGGLGQRSELGQRLGMMGKSQEVGRNSSPSSRKSPPRDEENASYLSRRGSTSLLTNSNLFY